jgi:hypothetical protein
MTVTVLVEAHEDPKFHHTIPAIWNAISSEEKTPEDIAYILRDHGVDVASVCSHLKKKEEEGNSDDVELF